MEYEITHNGLRARRIGGTSKYIREDGVLVFKYKSKEGYKVTRGTKQKNKYLNGFVGGKQVGMHRLVATEFLPNPTNLPVVDHINEDKEDNRVSNLRWCTHAQNSKYYHNLPGRLEKREFMQSTQDHYKALEDVIATLHSTVGSLEKENALLLLELEELKKVKLREVEDFEEYKVKEIKKIEVLNKNYTGYKTTTGSSYNNVAAMVQATGKKITVDGTEYISAGSAATYIVNSEALKGVTRKHSTISKELRRYLQGKRSMWVMYDLYTIGY